MVRFIDAKEAMGFSRKYFEMILKGVDLFLWSCPEFCVTVDAGLDLDLI